MARTEIEHDPDSVAYALACIPWAVKGVQHEIARLHRDVARSRARGATWQQIADVMGITRQAAQQRFSGVSK